MATAESLMDYRAGLQEKIEAHEAVVAVVGAGYVGLPLAVEKVKIGFPVLAIDQNADRVARLRRGESYIDDVPSEDLRRALATGRLRAAGDFEGLREAQVIIICVPTPLTPNREPDLSHISKVTEEIAARLRPGRMVILESTTYPGTTEEVILPLLQESGLTVGSDFFLAFSPERVDPGNKRYTTCNINKLVGGVTAGCLDVAVTFYSQTIQQVIPVSSPRVAEMAKVFENTFRSVNIALVNELALLCDRMDLNVWEVLDAAFTKPFGIMKFYPGPGVGGHCISTDPFYLAWKAREYDFATRFIELAGEINRRMPYHVVDRIRDLLGDRGRSLRGSRVLVLGAAYKADLADTRESPAVKMMLLLRRAGADVCYHDPFVAEVRLDRDGPALRSIALTEEMLRAVHIVVIATDHSTVDYRLVIDAARLVLDTRNATRALAADRRRVHLL